MKRSIIILILGIMASTTLVPKSDAGLTITNFPWWGISFSYRTVTSPSDVNGFGPPYEEWDGLYQWISEREANYRIVDAGGGPLADFCLSRGQPGDTGQKPSFYYSGEGGGWCVRNANYTRRVSDILIDLTWASNYAGRAEASLQWDVISSETYGLPVRSSQKITLPLEGITDVRIAAWPGWPDPPALELTGANITIPDPPKLYFIEQSTSEGQPKEKNTPDIKAEHGDPINGLNGNVSISETDIVIPAAGLPLEFRRSYNTVLDTDGTLGPRWSHNYQWQIWETNTVFNGATNRWLVLRAGDDWHWKPLTVLGGGHEIVDADWLWTAVKTNDAYTVKRPGGYIYRFGTNGLLQGMADAFSNGVALAYTNLTGVQRLARVEHSDGRALVMTYSLSNQLDRIETFPTNLTVTYGYKADGVLTNTGRSVGGVVETTHYDWDSAGQTITQRVDNSGEPRVWEYVGAKGVRSYVGTNRWNETSLDYGPRSMNQTYIKRYRGDTNIAVRQEYDFARDKVLSTSVGMPPQQSLWPMLPGQIFTNVVIHSTRSWVALTNNGYYRSLLASASDTNTSSRESWSGVRYTVDDYGKTVGIEERDSRLSLPEWSQQKMAYDADHRLTNSAYGYQVSATNAWSYAWNTNWNTLASVTDPEGRTTEWDYNNGALSVERSYPVANQPIEAHYAFTSNGLMSAMTNANGHWSASQYNEYGYPTQTLSQAGITNCMTWNALGHLIEVRMPGRISSTNDPSGMIPRIISYDPDDLGRVHRVTYPDDSQETFAFDGIGNVTNHVDPAGRTTRYTWLPTRKMSSISRTLTGTSNTEAKIEFAYDQQFNALNIKDELGRAVESYTLDLDDRPIKVTNVENQEMSIVWGLGGKVKSMVRFDGSTNGMAYDEGGRVKQMTYPDAAISFRYAKNGLLIAASNQFGVVSNVYDGANRLILTQSSGLPVQSAVAYQLDAVGNPTNTQVSNIGYNVSRTFDVGERLSSLTVSPSSLPAFEFAYSAIDGLPSSSSLPNGVQVQYERDSLDRVTSMIWRNASNQVLRSRAFGYSPAGMITNAVYESGEQVTYTYDSLDRLTGEKHVDPYGQVLSEDGYEYDLAGNRTKKTVFDSNTNTLATVNYTLAAGNRLASWSIDAAALMGRVGVMGYVSELVGTNDNFGSLWVSNTTDGAVKPQIDGTNFWVNTLSMGEGTQKLEVAIRDMAGNTTHVTNTILLTVVTNGTHHYNAAGCVTNIAHRGADYAQTLGLSWNGQYQVTAATTNGTPVERYGYDAHGRRIMTWDAGNGTNWHVYDGPHVVADLNASGSLIRTYVWGPGIDNMLAITTYGGTTNTYYPLKDHLGSVLALTDTNGVIVESYRYDAWGRTTLYNASGSPLSVSTVGNRYLWQGREYSSKTGLYYFRARWYDPVTGRWLSNDPIGISGGLNQYVFCANNPVNYIDPFGLAQEWTFRVNVERGGSRSPGSCGINYMNAYGHAWVTLISPSGGQRDWGISRSTFHNSLGKYKSKVCKEYKISEDQVFQLIQFVLQYRRDFKPSVKRVLLSDGTYDAASENCVDFTYKAAVAAGVKLPGSAWGINTPDGLADLLQNVQP